MKHISYLLKLVKFHFVFLFFAFLNIFGFYSVHYLIKNQSFAKAPPHEIVITNTCYKNDTIATDDNLYFEFSRALKKNEPQQFIKITPPIKGQWEWRTDRYLVFKPDLSLPPNSKYKVSFTSFLDQGKQLSFKNNTIDIKVTDFNWYSVYQYDYTPQNDLFVNLGFNSLVNPAQIRQSLYCRNKNDVFKFTVLTNEASKVISIKIENFNAEKINFTIKKGFAPVRGINTTYDLVKEFKFNNKFKLSLGNVSTDKDTGELEINYNCEIDLDHLKKNIAIEPPIDFIIKKTWRGAEIKAKFEPRKKYYITISKKLKSLAGYSLQKDIHKPILFPDYETFIKSNNDFSILGRNGELKISYSLCNIDAIEVTLNKIPQENYFFIANNELYPSYQYKEKLATKKIKINSQKNTVQNYEIQISDLFKDISNGLYNITITYKKKEYRYLYDETLSSNILITDLGASCRINDKKLIIWVTSLSSNQVLKNASVKIYSSINKLIHEGKTNENGILIIDRSTEIKEEPKFILVNHENDNTYLELKHNLRNNQSIYKKSFNELDAHVVINRTKFRAGEKISFDCIVRDNFGKTSDPMGIKVDVINKDGNQLFTKNSPLDELGAQNFKFETDPNTPSGKYLIRVFTLTGDLLTHKEIEINPIVPKRIHSKIQLEKEFYKIGDVLKFAVQANYLTELPAADITFTANLNLKETPVLFNKNWKSYKFGIIENKKENSTHNIGSSKTNKEGQASFSQSLDFIENTFKCFEINLITYSDDSADPLETTQLFKYFSSNQYLGCKETWASDGTLSLSLAMVDSDESIVQKNKKFKFKIMMIQNAWEYIKINKYYEYVKKEILTEVDSGDFNLIEGQAILHSTKCDLCNEVILEIYDESKAVFKNRFVKNSVNDTSPINVEIKTPKSIAPGENLKVEIQSPVSGKSLLCLETLNETQTRVINIIDGVASEIFETDQHIKNTIHVTCTVLQDTSVNSNNKLFRAYGQNDVEVENDTKKININWLIPSKLESSARLNINGICNDINGQAVPNAKIKLYISDSGLLNISNEQTFDLFSIFYGHRNNQMREYDYFNDILFEKFNIIQKLKPGGGGDSLGHIATSHSNQSELNQRFKIIDIDLGYQTTDQNGCFSFTKDLPEYQGALKIKSFVFDEDKFGSIEASIIINDDIQIEENIPKYLYQNNMADVSIRLINTTLENQNITLKLLTEDSLSILENKDITQTIIANEQKTFHFNLQSNETIGTTSIHIIVECNQKHFQKIIDLPILSKSKPIKEVSLQSFDNKKELSFESRNKWVDSKVDTEIEICESPISGLKETFEYLIQYPHGCGEQTTSKLLAMIMIPDFQSNQPEATILNNYEYFLNCGLTKLEGMQTSTGGVKLWPGDRHADLFVSAYCAFFLKQYFNLNKIKQNAFSTNLINYLKQNFTRNDSSNASPYYIAYILSTYQALEFSDVKKYIGHTQDLSKIDAYYLYMTLSNLDFFDQELFNQIHDKSKNENQNNDYYNSIEKESAIQLLMALDYKTNFDVHQLALNLFKQQKDKGHWSSTHNNAWCLFALMKYMSHFKSKDQLAKFDISADGQKYLSDSPYTTEKFKGYKKLKVTSSQPTSAFCKVTYHGLTSNATNSISRNTVSCKSQISLFESDKLTLTNEFVKNQIYQFKLSVLPPKDTYDGVITFYLPPGFSFYNHLLDDSPNNEIKKVSIREKDIKDDRVYIYTNLLQKGKEYEISFYAKSNCAGSFSFLGFAFESMYDPDTYYFSQPIEITVTEK